MGKATLRRGLVDTPLLLLMLRGDDEAYQFARDMLKVAAIGVSASSALVALASAQDAAALAERQEFLKSNRVYTLTARIARRAFTLITQLPPPSPITADDAIIAATAIEHSLPLYTLDPARFSNIAGVAAIQPY
jgi:predicted nucleic acid-binding protein